MIIILLILIVIYFMSVIALIDVFTSNDIDPSFWFMVSVFTPILNTYLVFSLTPISKIRRSFEEFLDKLQKIKQT